MAFSYGFFDSKNGDRKYDATEFSSIFDGIIKDGVYMDIGDHYNVTANGTSMSVFVGTGRAWFDHTWSLNTSAYELKIDQAEVVQNRIDAIVLDIDHRDAYRLNTLMVVKGTRSTSPVRPTLINEQYHKQYPLAYITIAAGTTAITTSMIENMVGTSACPFVTGIIQTISVDDLIDKWESQWNEKMASSEYEFNEWFSGIKNKLSTDAAGKLQEQLDWSTWTILKSGWSSSTIANLGDGQSYYTYTLQLNGVYIETPLIERAPSGTNSVQTVAEAEAFTLLTAPQGWAILDTDKKTITFYAHEKPTSDITLKIQGVS